MQYIAPLAKLIEHFRALPGIGNKTAVRLAYHVLDMDVEQAKALAGAIVEAKEKIGYCNTCFNLSDQNPCAICGSDQRDHSLICVVEQPQDVAAVERMLLKYVPELDEAGRQRFVYAFFPFIYGIYPYTSVTEKQKTAITRCVPSFWVSLNMYQASTFFSEKSLGKKAVTEPFFPEFSPLGSLPDAGLPLLLSSPQADR